MTRRLGLGLGTLIVGLLVIGGGYTLTHPGNDTATATTRSASASPGQITDALRAAGLIRTTAGAPAVDTPAVEALLKQIPPTSSAPPPAYDRAAFGPAWADSDHNGCDQRNDVLTRDMTDLLYKPGTHDCVVLRGKLADAYTGTTILFTRGQATSTAVQADHLVPLGFAWKNGASAWDEPTRQQLATDLSNLQTVDGHSNMSKSDQGPATWLPPAADYACVYVTRFTFILSTYHLTIDTPDRTAILRVLQTCN